MILFFILKIFDKYKYDNSFLGLKTISCSNLNFAFSNFFFLKRSLPSWKYRFFACRGFAIKNNKKIIYQLQGGLRSSMGYIGAKNLNEIKSKAKFIKITKAGFYESMVHSVEMIEPTLNYKL